LLPRSAQREAHERFADVTITRTAIPDERNATKAIALARRTRIGMSEEARAGRPAQSVAFHPAH